MKEIFPQEGRKRTDGELCQIMCMSTYEFMCGPTFQRIDSLRRARMKPHKVATVSCQMGKFRPN